MKTAIHLNIPIHEYEEMTPYELNLCAEVYNEKKDNEAKEKVTLVWLGEYYHRQKTLKSLKRTLHEFFGGDQHYMTDEEMLQKAKELQAKFENMFN